MLGAVLALPGFGMGQTTWYVPDDWPSIQAAIDGALDGDTIIVRPGTYLENICFRGKAITVKSESGAGATVIDGGQAGSVVTMAWWPAVDAVLDGFTITNGHGVSGGGIYCSGARATIINNRIVENSADLGGGIYGGAVMIAYNVVSRNTALYEGGGVFLFSSAATITHNVISGNAGADGGGVSFWSSAPAISCNTVIDNSAAVGGGIDFNPDYS